MSPQNLHLLAMGLVFVLIAAVVLVSLVARELAPSGGLSGRGKWMLTLGLGMGVFAFAAKLTLIFLIAAMPDWLVASVELQPMKAEQPFDMPRVDVGASVVGKTLWRPLPDQAPSPPENPWTAAKAKLGRQLFFDKNLSADGQLSCASCHELEARAGADGRATALGIHGQVGGRNAPTVWNAAFQSVLFWDGRAASLEEQAKGPLINPVEMGMPSHAAVEQRVRENPSYAAAFRQAFGEKSRQDIDEIVAAIAAFERTLITPDSPYDRFVKGDRQALSAAQLRGMALFESVGCVQCHSGPNFSGASLFPGNAPYRFFPAKASLYQQRYGLVKDRGLADSLEPAVPGIWRVPSLRNVALTAPYLHNGSVDDLSEVVRIMATVQVGLPMANDRDRGVYSYWSAQDHTLTQVERNPLTEQQVKDIVAFLRALSSDRLVRGKGIDPLSASR